MRAGPELATVVCLIGLAVLAAGCPAPGPELVRRPSLRQDACAERLHELCGHLLLYYSTHGKLPPTLAELTPDADLPLPPLVCPISGKPYVYDSRGVSIPSRPGSLVLYDPEASHSGMRWGILVSPSADRGATGRVILVAEKDLAAGRRPGPDVRE